MTQLIDFKQKIENLCAIIEWNPTVEQLEEIKSRFSLTPPQSVSDALGIVRDVCPDTWHAAMEGMDNSDLNTLLALAIAAAKE